MRMVVMVLGLLFAWPAFGQGMPAEHAPERQTMVGPYDVPAPPEERPAFPYEPGDRVPPGYHVEHGFHTPMLACGGVLLAFNYALSVVAARADVSLVDATFEDEASGRNMQPLYVPVIGPFIALGGKGWVAEEQALLALDGVAQLGGFALMMAGLWVRESYLVYGQEVSITATPEGASLAF